MSKPREYEAALDRLAASGFVSQHDACTWMRNIVEVRHVVVCEAKLWGITVEDILEISSRIFKKHHLI